MRYTSQVTPKGNSSYSYRSQADADAKAAALDAASCSDCSHCSGCLDCSGEIIQAGRPNGYQCYGWLKDGALFIHCGCRRKTFSEAIEYWFNKPDRAEILLACHYIADIARLKGWTI